VGGGEDGGGADDLKDFGEPVPLALLGPAA
jgi:hypothetical protein